MDGVKLRFNASLSILGDRQARFYLLDTQLNRNNWRVTEKALREALPDLRGKPLGCIPGYRVNHVHKPLIVGSWLEGFMVDGHAEASAKISDDTAWRNLVSGQWGPVSVVINASLVSCSLCGGDVTDLPDSHILRGEAHDIVEEFRFIRVDFVSEPVYPRAGVFRSKMDGVVGPQVTDLKPRVEEKKMEEKEKLEKMLQASRDENQRLKDELYSRERNNRIGKVLAARSRAGLSSEGVGKLENLSDEALMILEDDAEHISKRMAGNPRARRVNYRDLESAMEDARSRLFGYRRENS